MLEQNGKSGGTAWCRIEEVKFWREGVQIHIHETSTANQSHIKAQQGEGALWEDDKLLSPPPLHCKSTNIALLLKSAEDHRELVAGRLEEDTVGASRKLIASKDYGANSR